MNKQAVLYILNEIFQFYGFKTASSEISDIRAEKDNEHLFITFEQTPNSNNIRYFSYNVQRYGGKGIVVSESFDEKTRMQARNEGITLWDRSDTELWVGKAVISGALIDLKNEIPEPDLSEETPVELPFAPANSEGISVPEQPRTETERSIKILLRTVPLNIGKSDSLSIAGTKIGTPKAQVLVFIPTWYYSYSFSVQKRFKSRLVDLSGEGEGYVNALTGENFFIKYRDIQDIIMVPTQNYEIRKPAIEKRDAASRVLDTVIRAHTKEARLNEMIGDTIVFEHKIFAPEPEDINLKMDILHIPIWEIRSKRELVEINGYDGHIMGIRVYNDAEIF
jgi:hypothetical protein